MTIPPSSTFLRNKPRPLPNTKRKAQKRKKDCREIGQGWMQPGTAKTPIRKRLSKAKPRNTKKKRLERTSEH